MLFITHVKMSLVLGSLYNKLFRWGMCKVMARLATLSTRDVYIYIIYYIGHAGTSR